MTTWIKTNLWRGLFGASAFFAASALAAEKPTFEHVAEIVQRHLNADRSYEPGDLIARGTVEPIFNELLALGVTPVVRREELYDSFLPDNDGLVHAMRTNRGKKFMRAIKSMPGAFDRLERLSWLPAGREMLEQLIAAEEGPELFAAMLTPEGTKAIRERFATDARGRNFALPTGRIHTADELLARLKQTLSPPTVEEAEEELE